MNCRPEGTHFACACQLLRMENMQKRIETLEMLLGQCTQENIAVHALKLALEKRFTP